MSAIIPACSHLPLESRMSVATRHTNVTCVACWSCPRYLLPCGKCTGKKKLILRNSLSAVVILNFAKQSHLCVCLFVCCFFFFVFDVPFNPASSRLPTATQQQKQMPKQCDYATLRSVLPVFPAQSNFGWLIQENELCGFNSTRSPRNDPSAVEQLAKG